MKTSAKVWLMCGIIGLFLSVFALFVLDKFPADAHSIAPGYGGPVFAFEMAKDQADLIAVFGPETDPERARRITQMDVGNLWDYPFMLIYSLFMAAFMWAAYREMKHKTWIVLTGVALLSGAADAVENLILLGLTKELAGAPNIAWLGYPVWTKFLSIMVCVIAAGVFIFRQKHWIWKALGIAAIIGGFTIFAAFLAPDQHGHLIRHGTTVGWVIMLIFAWARWFQQRKKVS